ncbi:MAG: CHAT domain-containing protein [Rhodopirellula sp.]|nr:CHAT domain-containing protein [Rhodopirellula sp.]
MNQQLQHNQTDFSGLTIRARLIDDHKTVAITVFETAGNEVSRTQLWRTIEDQVTEARYLLNSAWQGSPNPTDEADLRRCVTELSELIFDAPTCAILTASTERFLMIDAPLTLHRIPWEMLLAGGQVIGERFAVGRKVTGLTIQTASAGQQRRMAHVASVPCSDLTWTAWELPAVRSALRRLAMNSAGRLSPPEPTSARITVDEIRRCLMATSWLHFAGHSESASGGRGWVVEPDFNAVEPGTSGVLTPDDVRRLHTLAPDVVFAHGCGTLAIPDSPDATLCMVEALLGQGTRWLLGPTVPTLDNECRHMVEPFYDGIVRGLPVGEALRLARVQATQRCPGGEARWLSYVLYGDPVECFVADFQSTFSAPNRSPLVVRTDGLFTDGPDVRVVAKRDEDNPSEAVLHQPAVADSPAGLASGHSETPAPAFDQSGNRLLHVRKQFQAAVKGFREYRDFRTGQIVSSRLENWSNGEHSSWTFESFGKPRTPPTDENTFSSGMQFRLVSNTAGNSLPHLRLSIEFLDALDGDAGASSVPVTADWIDAHLTGADSKGDQDAGSHEIRVFVSTVGFDAAAISRYGSESSSTALRPGLSVVLIDLSIPELHYRPTDLDLMPFLPLFELNDEECSVQQVVDYVTAELPLAASLGLRTAAAELQLPERIVAAGFRVAAGRHGLSLDDLPQHGLVLSEPAATTADDTASDNNKLPQSKRKKWFGALLLCISSFITLGVTLSDS